MKPAVEARGWDQARRMAAVGLLTCAGVACTTVVPDVEALRPGAGCGWFEGRKVVHTSLFGLPISEAHSRLEDILYYCCPRAAKESGEVAPFCMKAVWRGPRPSVVRIGAVPPPSPGPEAPPRQGRRTPGPTGTPSKPRPPAQATPPAEPTVFGAGEVVRTARGKRCPELALIERRDRPAQHLQDGTEVTVVSDAGTTGVQVVTPAGTVGWLRRTCLRRP